MRDIQWVMVNKIHFCYQWFSRTTVRIEGKFCFKDYSVPYLFYALNNVVNSWTSNKGCPLHSNSWNMRSPHLLQKIYVPMTHLTCILGAYIHHSHSQNSHSAAAYFGNTHSPSIDIPGFYIKDLYRLEIVLLRILTTCVGLTESSTLPARFI